jgi:hypothetical protein
VTAIPISTADVIVTVVVRTTDHESPSAETDATMELPLRASFSHAGAACVVLPTTVVGPPTVVLARNSIPPFGRRFTRTFGAFAFSDSRIMTPALA